jgi:hypothetical protein
LQEIFLFVWELMNFLYCWKKNRISYIPKPWIGENPTANSLNVPSVSNYRNFLADFCLSCSSSSSSSCCCLFLIPILTKKKTVVDFFFMFWFSATSVFLYSYRSLWSACSFGLYMHAHTHTAVKETLTTLWMHIVCMKRFPLIIESTKARLVFDFTSCGCCSTEHGAC